MRIKPAPFAAKRLAPMPVGPGFCSTTSANLSQAMLPAPLPLTSLQLTNQRVVVCDLALYTGGESAAWIMLRGSQDDIGASLAALLEQRKTTRLDDFGGVCRTFLCDGDTYLASPPKTKAGGSVFSFAPKNRLAIEGQGMARVARAAGYDLLIVTVQKHDKFGKAWVLAGILRHFKGDGLIYYEDTNTVVDEIKSSPRGHRIHVVHVQAPGFEESVSKLADRVITQHEYRREVLQDADVR